MKKLICLLLVAVLLCGCGKNKQNIQTPVNFYYRNAEMTYDAPDAVLSPEVREGAGYNGDLVKLLNLYLAGPLSDEFYSPFPANTTVVSAFLSDTTLTVELSAAFAELQDLDLTMACACLARTTADLTECSRIKIYVSDAKLDGNAYITLDTSDLLLVDSVD